MPGYNLTEAQERSVEYDRQLAESNVKIHEQRVALEKLMNGRAPLAVLEEQKAERRARAEAEQARAALNQPLPETPPYEEWTRLTALDPAAADRYYTEHKAAIQATAPKPPVPATAYEKHQALRARNPYLAAHYAANNERAIEASRPLVAKR